MAAVLQWWVCVLGRRQHEHNPSQRVANLMGGGAAARAGSRLLRRGVMVGASLGCWAAGGVRTGRVRHLLAGGRPGSDPDRVVRAVRVWEWQPPPSCLPALRDRPSRTPCREATVLGVSDRPQPWEVQLRSPGACTNQVSDEPDYLAMSQYHCSPSRLPEPSRLRRHGCPPCNFPASAMPCLSPASCAEEPSQRPPSGPRRPWLAPLPSHP